VRAGESLLRDVARALQECAAWHGTPEVVLRTADPPEMADRIEAALASLSSPPARG
jgi:uncharacterized protein